jgi:Fur family transcriptional regulator, ferric uptake regulator
VGSEHSSDARPPLAERLRARGMRLTPQRQQVLAAVNALEHGTPEDIAGRLRDEAGPDGAAPDSSTVYRTLELLERLGLVWHTHLGKGAPIYHSAGHRHLHVACATCGEVTSVDPGILDGAAERLLDEFGFTVDVGHVALSGTCRACRRTAKAEGSEGSA